MGLGGGWDSSPVSQSDIQLGHQVADAAFESGINLFDHADIYTLGKAEVVFGRILQERPDLRSQLYIQSKCAIRFLDANGPGRYDHSDSWIQQSVDGILERLGIEQLDVLLLHRPDPLLEPEALAETLNNLQASGKVKYFGVSNMHQHQMQLIESKLNSPLIINQLEMSLGKLGFVEQGVTVAMDENASVGFAPGIIEYCQLNNVQLQSWGSLAQGMYSTPQSHKDEPSVSATKQLVVDLAQKYQSSKEGVVLGWLMRLPMAIQPIIGTTNIDRITACSNALNLAQTMTREDWYKLYVAARGHALP
jgi:predicted oxidoreductase